MSTPFAVLYLPGLGDDAAGGQRRAISTWALWGVRAEEHPMDWARAEGWGPKFDRLLARIDALTASGLPLGLVGASAGAAAVINAFAARRTAVAGCVLIAGKVHHPETVGDSYRQRAPDLVAAIEHGQRALGTLGAAERKRIMSRFAFHDAVVPNINSRIPGARNERLASVGHTPTIAGQLLVGAPSFLRFLKTCRGEEAVA